MSPLKSESRPGRNAASNHRLTLRHWVRRRGFIRARRLAGEAALILGLMLAPALAAIDLSVWSACRDRDTHACLAGLAAPISAAVAAEAGLGGGVSRVR